MRRRLHCVGSHLRPTAVGLFVLFWAWVLLDRGVPTAAAVTAAVGVGILSFRALCRIDLDEGGAGVYWGLFGLPLILRHHTDPAGIRAVKLRREIRYRNRAKKTSSYEVFIVELKAEPDLKLRERRDFAKARVFAEQTARRLNLPLLDTSTGRQRRREPETLDLTLGQRLRKQGAEPEYPSLPGGTGMRFRDRGRIKEIVLPAQPLHWLGLVIGMGIPGLGFALTWFTGHEIVALWVASPLFLLLAGLIGGTFLPRRIRIGPDDIRVRWLYLRQRMRFDELEEVVSSRLDLYLLSDRKRIGLPYDFKDPAEARFLVALIEYLAWQHPSSRTPLEH